MNTLNMCSCRRTGATGFVAPRAGSTAHHRIATRRLRWWAMPTLQILNSTAKARRTQRKSSVRQKYFYILCALCVFAVSFARAEVAVPPLTARVTDLTGTLTPAQRDTLERELQAFESRKGSQIAVLIVPTTRPEAIEQYSLRVAETWKLGRKGVDDGVLLLVAKDDRELRIEVGYGLED